MTAEDPQGLVPNLRQKAYGRWAGFYRMDVLVLRSVDHGEPDDGACDFLAFWFPGIPMWIFASGYAVLGLFVIWIGNKGFDRLENVLAVIKIAAIVMFLVIACRRPDGVVKRRVEVARSRRPERNFSGRRHGHVVVPDFAFYAFGGIEVMGVMAIRLKNPKEAPKAGRVMILPLSIVYVLSIGMAVIMVAWNQFSTTKSPFVVALSSYQLPFIPHIFNAVLIIAGFSTMVASLYAVTTMLVTLSEDKDAPKLFAMKSLSGIRLYALSLTAVGLIVSIVLSLLMPGKIYEYLTTGAGLMSLYNWFFILISAGRLIELTVWGKIKRYIGMLLIAAAVSGTALHPTSRPGLWISLGFILVIGLVVLCMRPCGRNPGKAMPERRTSPSFVLSRPVRI